MPRPTNNPLAHVGPYELLERVGIGGMGSVYRARDPRDGRTVALKLMHEHVASDPAYAERFRREAAVATLIDSPNVVRVLEFASDGGRPYIVTEFVEGPSLEELLKRGPLPATQAAAVAAGIATGLAEAARRNIVHRDIKPANILIDSAGVPRVTDFGIATMTQTSSLTVAGSFIGTAAYAAPEQHYGQADSRSDIYSLGVVLFEMLTGSLPFAAETATGMMRKHEEAAVPLERLAGQPASLSAAVARCLEKSPVRRFQDAEQLAAALTGADAAPSPADATVVVASLPVEPTATVVGHPTSGPGGDPAAAMLTGEHPFPTPPLAAVRLKLAETPLLRNALIAGAAVAVLTAVAMFSFKGSSAEQPVGGSGGGIPGPVQSQVTVTTTPQDTATQPPKKERTTVTPSPSPTVSPTTTPTASPTTAPKVVPPAPPPAPVLEVVDWVFCHLAGCPYGYEDLYAGYPIAIGFRLNVSTSLPVSVEVNFDGEYQYTSNFSPSATGMYFDILPWANYSGELTLDIYVGGEYLDTLWAEVY